MELWNAEIEKKALLCPLYSKESQGKDAEVLVKYFNPYGAGTWLITEAERQEDGDWLLFGYCHILETTFPTKPRLSSCFSHFII